MILKNPNKNHELKAIVNALKNKGVITDEDIEQEKQKIKGKKESIEESEDFKPHWMYGPKTGEKERAEKPEDHERLASKGWIHEPKKEGEGKYKGEKWEDGFKRRVVKTTDSNHLEKGFKWRIKGKERDEISIKLYKEKPDFEEYKKQMKRVAGHEFGG